MLIALLLSGTLVAASGETAAPRAVCSAMAPMKSKMANIAHAAVLYFGDSFAGALYGTAGGGIWYQSQVGGSTAGDAARKRAMKTLGIAKDTSSGTLVQASKPNVADLLAPDVHLKGCF